MLIRKTFHKFGFLFSRSSIRPYSNDDIKKPFEEMYQYGDVYLTPKHLIPRNTLIWLHDCEETGKSYVPMFNKLNSVVPLDTKIIMPTANERHASQRDNLNSNSWYTMDHTYSPGVENFNQIQQSTEYIREIIMKEAENYKLDFTKIVLGGFGQGCAIALWLFLTQKEDFGGLCGFSGYLFDFVNIKENSKQEAPILLCHGRKDEFIPLEYAQFSYKRLNDFGMNMKLIIENDSGHFISKKGEELMKYYFTKLFDENIENP